MCLISDLCTLLRSFYHLFNKSFWKNVFVSIRRFQILVTFMKPNKELSSSWSNIAEFIFTNTIVFYKYHLNCSTVILSIVLFLNLRFFLNKFIYHFYNNSCYYIYSNVLVIIGTANVYSIVGFILPHRGGIKRKQKMVYC